MGILGRIRRWLQGEKRAEPSPNPFPPDDPRHETFEALWGYRQALGERAARRMREGPRELVLREVPDDVLMASRELLKEYREQWEKAPPEKRRVIYLLPEATRRTLQQEVGQATGEIEGELRRRGVKDRAHYYGAAERAATGEVDRTYDTARPEKPVEGLGEDDAAKPR